MDIAHRHGWLFVSTRSNYNSLNEDTQNASVRTKDTSVGTVREEHVEQQNQIDGNGLGSPVKTGDDSKYLPASKAIKFLNSVDC